MASTNATESTRTAECTVCGKTFAVARATGRMPIYCGELCKLEAHKKRVKPGRAADTAPKRRSDRPRQEPITGNACPHCKRPDIIGRAAFGGYCSARCRDAAKAWAAVGGACICGRDWTGDEYCACGRRSDVRRF